MDNHLALVNPFYRMDIDAENPHPAMVNYCEHCHAEIDDDYLFGGNGFLFPLDDDLLEKGLLRHIVSPFKCKAGYVLSEDYWEGARVVKIAEGQE
jgi:hypothetical protein